MFKKPFTSKTSAPLRSSDLRKLEQEVSRDFSVSSHVARQLVPDTLLAAKALTHVDEAVTVYSDKDGNPLWLRVEGAKGADSFLVPTVYTLQRVIEQGGLLPSLETAEAVVPNLVSGAALFAKGVSQASSSKLPDDLPLGSLVQITVGRSQPTVVAVGQLSATKTDIQQGKGKAAATLHARGDYLWKTGGEQDLPPVDADSEADEISTKAGSSSRPETPPPRGEPPVAEMANVKISNDNNLTPSDVDRLLRQALLLAISKMQPSSLPIQASSLYSSHVLPNRPAECPAGVEIKKSSFKNLSKWVKALVKEGLVTGKEVRGEWMITAVSKDHPEVQGVHTFKTVSQASAAQKDETNDMSAPTEIGALAVRELYKPNSTARDVLADSDFAAPPGNLYTFSDLKKAIASYATKHSIVHPHEQKYINLDARLSSILLKKSESIPTMSRDEAVTRLRDSCTKFWTASSAGDTSDAEVRKGSPPVVRVQVKRVGKRDVTLVSHFEEWDVISAKDLAEELKITAASSSSVQPMQGSSPKKPVMEVMVQGSQEQLVKRILTARGIPSKYIEVEKKK